MTPSARIMDVVGRWRMRSPLVAGIAGVLAVAFAAAVFLWPDAANRGHVDVGSMRKVLAHLDRLEQAGEPIEYGDPARFSLRDLLARLDEPGEPINDPARFYLVRYPAKSLADGLSRYPEELWPGMRAGLLVLAPRSPHHGVRLYWCQTSGWFEDPAYGEKFNTVGEHVVGASRRGMDHFAVRVVGDRVIVDTTRVIPGVPVGTDTTHEAPAGPHCVT